jgi:hypothetical protein
MPKPGATIIIAGIKATVDPDGNWSLPVPPANKPTEVCTQEEFFGRALAKASAAFRPEYSPADGDPSAAYAEFATHFLGMGEIVDIVYCETPPGSEQ